MVTDNYLKARRGGTSRTVEFFFRSRDEASRTRALSAASQYASEVTELTNKPAVISVWAHGVPGFGDLPCVGGCSLCALSEGDEEGEDEDEPKTS